ncbi:MAG: oxidoreductase, partial [Gammaproteobacteria bacterium]|nr:oxidoreductase [Gammaproteobacteria bacterium]
LYGIDSVYASQTRRQAAWNRLASSLDSTLLGGIVQVISLGETIPAAEAMLAGKVVGRYLVDVNR